MIRFFKLALIFCLSLFLLSAGGNLAQVDSVKNPLFSDLFPALYFSGPYQDWVLQEGGKPYWAPTELEEYKRLLDQARPFFLNNDVVAFYGHPLSKNMGILGRYEIDELNTLLNTVAAEYREASGQRGILKAFYIIYGTVQPKGEIGYIPDSLLQTYIRFALEHKMLVFIDHQIGRYDPVESLKLMLPYLHYPNVHLALDPEWRTEKPMQQIGSITAEEINQAQELISSYLEKYHLAGERMLVIHQFHHSMIQDRMDVKTGYKRVTLIHCADGFGNPALKRSTYSYLSQAKNMPVKGFKLFYNFDIPGAGYDDPLLTPQEVYDLDPRPCMIMYQ